MSFSLSVRCPGCGGRVPVELDNPWVVLDKPYCSEECADANALSADNVMSDCPVCEQPQVEVGRTGKRRCVNDHMWELRSDQPIYLRDLTRDEIEVLRKQGLHA